MKSKHIQARINQCLAIAECSTCTRRKFGALILDPNRNVVLIDAYNGSPRGGSELCGGDHCVRDGKPAVILDEDPKGVFWVYVQERQTGPFISLGPYPHEEGLAKYRELKDPIESGTKIEIGCHHAEMNAICNAAANGVATNGAWMIVTGEPCRICAKLIHHAGITKVIVVKDGYMGSNGVSYLRKHGVIVEAVKGPKDPRLTGE